MRRLFVLICASSLLSGCSGFLEEPASPGEFYSGYNYVPLDPLPVKVVDGPNCGAGHPHGDLLKDLPDNAVRIAVRKLSGSGKLEIGPGQVGAAGNSYEVILDYINADVSNIRFRYTGAAPNAFGEEMGTASVVRVAESAPVTVRPGEEEVVIPVYVGVGLRLAATVTVLKGNVNLSSLGALTAAAEAERIRGTLVVQTLGITGPKVTPALPLPSELNSTTIQNAIVALGSVKSLIPASDTVIRPRVTGIYNPLPESDQRTINLIVSQLVAQPVEWKQDCSL